MKLLFITGREPAYIRNSMIKKALISQGIEIIECCSNQKSYFTRYPIVIEKILIKSRIELDAIFVGFFGQPLVPIIKKIIDKPIIFDAFLSGYDTICFDRKICNPDSLVGKLFYLLDRKSCLIADKILLDTNAHINYFVNTFFIEKNKFNRIFVGADEDIFFPIKKKKDKKDFKVFYYGTYKPLHGTKYILEAAKKLEKYKEIKFEIIGNGMEYRSIKNLANQLNISNVKFIKWVSYEFLPNHIAQADICLGGHFGSTEKARRVIAGKTFQFIAMKKPVIIGNNIANRELFEDGKNAFMVEHESGTGIADAILELKEKEDLTEIISENGYRIFKEKCAKYKIGEKIKNLIKELL